MTFELCESRGFSAGAIADRVALVGLADGDLRARGTELQDLVISPNIEPLVVEFYGSLLGIGGFSDIVGRHSDQARLQDTMQRYLLSLGLNFDTPQYFEERLRIGFVHQRIGIPQSLYQCSFQRLQCLLIQYIPMRLQRDSAQFGRLVEFILKITALDLSLAVESYCAARLFALESSLESACGERDRLHYLARTDRLTGLYNHSYCRQLLAEALNRAVRDKTPLCIIMADLDRFKEINDRYGHLVGDEALRIASARLISEARAGDEIGRYGGEEFLFVLRNTDITEGWDIAERVREKIKGDAVRSTGATLYLSISLGVAQARDGDDVDALIDRADMALYAAKLGGRDCVRTEDRT